MRIRIQKWGNSLALRIPKVFAAEARLEQDKFVEVSLVEGKLIIAPAVEPPVTLDQLLAGVTEQNLHRSLFIESLVRPHVIGTDLEAGYRQMAEDEARETEAAEWVLLERD